MIERDEVVIGRFPDRFGGARILVWHPPTDDLRLVYVDPADVVSPRHNARWRLLKGDGHEEAEQEDAEEDQRWPAQSGLAWAQEPDWSRSRPK